MTNTNEEVNPYVAQGNPYAVTSVEMSDYCSVDLTSPSAGGGENFERQAKEGAGKREGHVKGAVNNPYAAGRMTEGVFAKMGLKPAETFFCISPNICGLRLLMFVFAFLQAGYGLALLLVAIFSTLIGMFNATITFNIGQVVIVVLTFCIQVLIGLSYLVVGFYGIVATVNLKAILSATEASMKRTVMWFKLTLLAYLMTCALMISMAIINIFLGRTISTIFYWIWTAVWITIASYCLYMQWSYKHWVVAGSSEGPNGPSFAKILKAGTAPGDTSNPPTAPPASSV